MNYILFFKNNMIDIKILRVDKKNEWNLNNCINI